MHSTEQNREKIGTQTGRTNMAGREFRLWESEMTASEALYGRFRFLCQRLRLFRCKMRRVSQCLSMWAQQDISSCQTHLRILSLSDPHSPEHLTSNLGAAHSDPLMPDSLESPPLRAPVWEDPCTSPWIPLQYKGYLRGQHKCDNSDP